MGKFSIVLLLSVVLLQNLGLGEAWGSSQSFEKVKLEDVRVITLKQGYMTTGRRSAPVEQLKCVGGTANCAFTPRVVQCYNRGSDGYDVQWECKTDMSNNYRFGDISVSCEGYDYPNDKYILKGSCALEYTIDLTEEGKSSHSYGGGSSYYAGGGGGAEYGWKSHLFEKDAKKSNFITNLACGAVVVIIVYAIYKTCITPTQEYRQRSSTNDDYHGRGPGSSPPPPGFRTDYYSTNNDYSSGSPGFGTDSCSGANRGTGSGTGSAFGRNAGGFWTGAAAGGLLGYMFGQRNNNTQYGGATYRPRPSTSWGSSDSGFFGGGYSGGGRSSSSSSTSSGSRSASGFGGTTRR